MCSYPIFLSDIIEKILKDSYFGALQHQCMADETFSNNVKILAALGFVPLNDVMNAFDMVVAQMPKQLDSIIDYIEKNYIGAMHRRGRRPPRFPLEL